MAKAGVVGAVGTGVHYGALAVGMYGWRLQPFLATAFGFLLGTITNYFLNRNFVFSSKTEHRVALWKFFAIAGVGLLVNMGTIYLVSKSTTISIWLVQVLVTVVVFVITFSLNKLWTFHKSPETDLREVKALHQQNSDQE